MTDPEQVRSKAFDEAAAAVDRFLSKFGEPAAGLAEAGEGALNRLRAELGRVVDLNLDLIRNAFAFYGSADGDGESKPDTLQLPPAVAGSAPTSIVWLHNFDEVERVDVRLIGSDLVGETGERIAASHWSFEPTTVTVPARSGVPVVARVDVPRATATHSYFGAVTAAGLDGPPIDVRLEVIGTDPVPHDSW